MNNIDGIVEKYIIKTDEKKELNENIIPQLLATFSLPPGSPLWYLQTMLIILLVMYGIAFFGLLRSSPVYDLLVKWFNKIKSKIPTELERFIEKIESDPEWPLIKKKLTNMNTKEMLKYFDKYLKEKGLHADIKVVHAATEKYWDELGV